MLYMITLSGVDNYWALIDRSCDGMYYVFTDGLNTGINNVL